MIFSKIKLAIAVLLMVALPALSEDMPEVADVALRSARIRAVGDLMTHQKQLDIALQSDGTYDFHPQYSLIAESLADADYTMANLETTIGMYAGQPYSGFPRFNAPESLLETIKDAGVDFLTLANNHMLDRYYDGLVTTVNNVEAFGFDFAGANRSPEERDMPRVFEMNGIKIGVLSYTAHGNDMERFCDPAAKEHGMNYLSGADFAADVQSLKAAGAEFIIAMPHWGTEYMRRPDTDVRRTAERMIAAGVDVILGSHPHMVQPLEYITVETEAGERTALVAWSLGNFISNMKVQYTDSGIILNFTLRENEDGKIEIADVGYVPIYCWRQDNSIRAISSAAYLDTPPEGMSKSTHSRMKESYRELIDLIGDEFAVLER